MPRIQILSLLSGILLFACSDETGSGAPDGSTADLGADVDLGGLGEDLGTGRTLLEVRLEPPQAELTSVDGAQVEQVFSAVGVYSDGSSGPLPRAEYSLEPLIVGSIGPSDGRFVANGVFGGEAKIRATVRHQGQVLEAEATVIVRLERHWFDPGISPNTPEFFEGPGSGDPQLRAQLVYPLDGAVMPENVFPADIQWLTAETGDIFEIVLSKPHVTVRSFVISSGGQPAQHWQVDRGNWRAVAQTDPEQALTIAVNRYQIDSRALTRGAPIQIRFVPAAVAGSVYYWDIQAGRVVRINDGTDQRDAFMPTPPAVASGDRCVGCHSISNSGRYMAGRLGGGNNIGGIFDLTRDLTVDPPPTEFPISIEPPSARWWFSSWSPDDSRLITSVDETTPNARLLLLDPFTGLEVTPAQGILPMGGVTHPAWSPTGEAIAFVSNTDTWGGNNITGDISVLPVTGPDSFGPADMLHSADSITPGSADSYPTWSPDGRLVVFANGSSSRSENGQASLYLVPASGGPARRLDKASGGAMVQDTFQPNFSPFHQGGYFWVSYLSRRDYGNAQQGTAGTGRQQIWVSAIKDNPQPGEDPSEVGYWLPGQDVQSQNIAAFWAPRACRPEGEACEAGAECCSGDCRPGMDGALVCSPPPPDGCLTEGQGCGASSECCAGLRCDEDVCSPDL